MSPEMTEKLKRSLVKHEGYQKFPYVDSVGKTTIGCGYNLTDRGMPDDWIIKQLQDDITFFYSALSEYSWFAQLNDDRKIILIDMAFQGLKKFLGFKKMISALEKSDFKSASHEMLNSKWAAQVKNRASDLAKGMEEGIYHV